MTERLRLPVARLLAAPLGVALLLVALLAAPAFAHATLIETDPADGEVLSGSPSSVSLRFSEPISPATQGNQLLDAKGRPVATTVSARDDTLVLTPDTTLADGTYIVSWRVISGDSHPVAGGFSFSVGAPSETVIAAVVNRAQREVTLVRVAAETARYAGVLGLAGLAVFAVLIADASVARSVLLRRRLSRARMTFAALGVGGSLALVPLVTIWQQGGSLGDLATGDTWRRSLSQAPALAALVVVAGIALHLVAHHRGWAATSVAAAAAAAGSVVLVGHTRVYGPPWFVLSSDLAHVTAGAIWLGGTVGLTLLLVPGDRDVRASEIALAIRRFSVVAGGTVAALAVSGLALWWRITDAALGGLWTTSYGRALLIKLALVAVVVAVAAVNRFRLVPAIEANRQRSFHLARLRRTVAFEAAILVAVTAVTGALVSQTPRPDSPNASNPASDPFRETVDLGSLTATVTITPTARGTNAVQLDVRDSAGLPVDPAEVPTLSVSLPSHELGPLDHTVTRTGTGRYEAIVDFPLPGTWTLTLGARLSRFENPVVSTKVDIP